MLRKSSGDLEKIDIAISDSANTEITRKANALVYFENAKRFKSERRKFAKCKSMEHVRKDIISEDKGYDDIENYYRKYEASETKNLIDILNLSGHEICVKCANQNESPVYSDRFVYGKQPLLAREVSLLQTSRDSATFRFLLDEEKVVDFMPICKLTKSNASGIFYNVARTPDVFDLKRSLEPDIVLLESRQSFRSTDDNNTQVYHRFLNKGYSRISERGKFEPLTAASKHKESREDFKVNIDNETDPHNWMEDMMRKEQSDEQNRSSLLMLEPLLLMSSETTEKKKQYEKKRLAQSEHLKLIRIVIAYSLSFFVLVSITFYVVYFT